MRTYRDAKAMATTLRESLRTISAEISHSQALGIVAKQFGLDNWNVLAARINAADEPKKSESSPSFQQAIPILRIFSVPKASEFYCDYLGFSVDWTHDQQGPVYMQVSRSQLRLHLTEHHGDGSPGSTVLVAVTHIDRFHAELKTKQYKFMNPGIEQLPWGRMLQIIDPFSNRLRFVEPVDSSHPGKTDRG